MAEPSGRALAVVDVGAVERNCRTLKERAGEGTELCAVVKANGYGHGAATCAAAALRGGATLARGRRGQGGRGAPAVLPGHADPGDGRPHRG